MHNINITCFYHEEKTDKEKEQASESQQTPNDPTSWEQENIILKITKNPIR